MKLPLLNIDGSKNSSIEISDKLVNKKLITLIKFVIDWQLNHLNLEQLKQNKETRSEVLQKKL